MSNHSRSLIFHFETCKDEEGDFFCTMEIEGLPGLKVQGKTPSQCLHNLGSALVHYRLQMEENLEIDHQISHEQRDVPPFTDQLLLLRFLTGNNESGGINTYLKGAVCEATLPIPNGQWEQQIFQLPQDPEALEILREDDNDDDGQVVGV